jgi:hypothetical protein
MEKGKIVGVITPDPLSNLSMLLIERDDSSRFFVPVENRYLEEIIESESEGDVYNLSGRDVEVDDGFIYFI